MLVLEIHVFVVSAAGLCLGIVEVARSVDRWRIKVTNGMVLLLMMLLMVHVRTAAVGVVVVVVELLVMLVLLLLCVLMEIAIGSIGVWFGT